MRGPTRRTLDRVAFQNRDLVLKVRPHDPAIWDETKYEPFLDVLCGHREYQKEAIRTVLSYWLGGRYTDIQGLARENFDNNQDLSNRWGRWETFKSQIQLPGKLACSVDLATGTGKSFVLYGIAAILMAENAVDKVLVLCPSKTIEAGLLSKFRELAGSSELRSALPETTDSTVAPRIISASETIVDGALCVENYHAVLDHVSSSIRDSLKGQGERVAVLNDEAHHTANESDAKVGKWKSFLQSDDFNFRFVLGVSGTCYVGNNYFSDVVFRYSLRRAIEEHFVKRVEYITEMPSTHSAEERWQLIWQRHNDWKKSLKSRNIRPLSIVVTKQINSCKQVAEELIDWLSEWEGIERDEAREKILVVTSAKEHAANLTELVSVDSPHSKVEWIISVSMLSEGWDVKNVFQIIPHEERAFNSKLLIAQVLGRGLRVPDGWTGDNPMVTVFSHDAWSGRIKQLVDEILEIELRLSSKTVETSAYHFDLHNIDYERIEKVTDHPQSGEYQIFEKGFVVLPSQVVNQSVDVEFEEAISGKHTRFSGNVKQKTYEADDVAEQLYLRLKSIDQETEFESDPQQRTAYSKRFTRDACRAIVARSLRQAGITEGLITDDNRQKLMQAIGPLRRKGAKRVVYELSPKALTRLSTSSRPSDSCSAAELRRGSKTVFYTENCLSTLADEQRDFFRAVSDPDGEFVSGRVNIGNPADFKTPMNLVIADATPERKFIRELTERKNALKISSWLKSTSNNFYSLEYAWKKGEHTKRGEFNPDFFLACDQQIIVVEIKDDGEIGDPSPENVKKHEYAVAHFSTLNKWLESEGITQRYQFNMLTPRDYAAFFQKLRDSTLQGYRSEIDVVMINAGSKGS